MDPELERWKTGGQYYDYLGFDVFYRTAGSGPALLLMGSEGPGLSPELATACSRLVKIPMAGRLDSLNLAVATALMLYEVRRERLRV